MDAPRCRWNKEVTKLTKAFRLSLYFLNYGKPHLKHNLFKSLLCNIIQYYNMIWLISYSHFYIFLVHSAMVADRYIENSIGQPYQLESWPLYRPKVGPNKFETSFCCYYRVSKCRLAVMERNCNYSSLAVMTRNWGSTRPKSYLIPTL